MDTQNSFAKIAVSYNIPVDNLVKGAIALSKSIGKELILEWKGVQILINGDDVVENILKRLEDNKNIISKKCSFCSNNLTNEDISDTNAFFLACTDHKELAQKETEDFFRRNPDYAKWNQIVNQ